MRAWARRSKSSRGPSPTQPIARPSRSATRPGAGSPATSPSRSARLSSAVVFVQFAFRLRHHWHQHHFGRRRPRTARRAPARPSRSADDVHSWTSAEAMTDPDINPSGEWMVALDEALMMLRPGATEGGPEHGTLRACRPRACLTLAACGTSPAIVSPSAIAAFHPRQRARPLPSRPRRRCGSLPRRARNARSRSTQRRSGSPGRGSPTTTGSTTSARSGTRCGGTACPVRPVDRSRWVGTG